MRFLQPEGLEVLPPSLLRAYIAMARTCEPTVPQELTEYICSAYVALRQRERDDDASGNEGRTYITPRTLMSILRLSQASLVVQFFWRGSGCLWHPCNVGRGMCGCRSGKSEASPDAWGGC